MFSCPSDTVPYTNVVIATSVKAQCVCGNVCINEGGGVKGEEG